MKISDPFCRVESRNEANYRSFREAMQSAGASTEQEVDMVSRRMHQKYWIALIGLACINLLVLLLFPTAAAYVAVLSAVVVLWLLTTVTRAKGFLNRYRKELVGAGEPGD